MKLASLKPRPRRHAGRGVARSGALRRRAGTSRPRCKPRWTTGHDAAPRLMRVYDLLNDGPVAGEKPFDPKDCAAPLPRAYQWADGSAYVTHVELVRKARGAEMPPSFWTDPLMYQGGSDGFIGPVRSDRGRRRSLGHRFRRRGRGDHRRRADGHVRPKPRSSTSSC